MLRREGPRSAIALDGQLDTTLDRSDCTVREPGQNRDPGESDPYRCLLEEITPYLRTLSARHQRDPNDIEDALQDILLTVHAIRHTYDPTRPFGPWLVAIANRRLIDQLRRRWRLRSRGSPFAQST